MNSGTENKTGTLTATEEAAAAALRAVEAAKKAEEIAKGLASAVAAQATAAASWWTNDSRIRLMEIYQNRLNHEYDKGWEQIRIIAYVSAGILAGGALLLDSSRIAISQVPNLIRVVALVGSLLSFGSLLNLHGSQVAAKNLRSVLSRLEQDTLSPPEPNYYANREQTQLTGLAIYVIVGTIFAFWILAFVMGPSIIVAPACH